MLSEDDKELLYNIRLRLQDVLTPHYDTDFNLLRWISGWDQQLDEIEPRLRKHLALRQLLQLDKITDDSYRQLAPAVLQQYYPGGVVGYGCNDDIVVIEPIGRADPRGLMPVTMCREFFMAKFRDTEYISHLIRQKEQQTGRQHSLVMVIDMEEFNFDKIWMPTMNIYITLINLMQENYPDLARKLYLIKGPVAMQVAYRMVLPFLSKKTAEKIEFIRGNEWKSKLMEIVSPDLLPQFWGGSKEGPDALYGSICMGGKIPTDLALKVDRPLETRNQVTISGGDQKHLEFVVDIPGSVLKWYLYTNTGDGDIKFGIKLRRGGGGENEKEKSQDEIMLPKWRINCEYVPEQGSVECRCIGTYLVVLDNRFSWIKSKRVFYTIDIVLPVK